MTGEIDAAILADLPVGQQLCLSCGMCCNAALHDFAVLRDDEEELAERLGLTIVEGERLRFHLPCHLLDGTACTVFRDRPSVCGRYRCQMLADVEDDGFPLADAVVHVRHAKKLLADIDALGVAGLTYAEARAIALPAINPDGARRAMEKIGSDPGLRDQVHLRALALLVYLDRHFRERGNGTMLVMSPIEPLEQHHDD